MIVTAIFVTSQGIRAWKTSVCSKAEDRFKRKCEEVRKGEESSKLIENEGVRLSSEDAADILTNMEENSDEVDDAFAEESLQHILWEQQKKYNALDK